MRAAVHAVDVIACVRQRLEEAGNLAGLYHLRGFSIDELDLLVRQELGMAYRTAVPRCEHDQRGGAG